MVHLNRHNRSVFFTLLAIVFGVHLHEIQAGWPMWVFTMVQLLVLPQLVYAWNIREPSKVRQRENEVWWMRAEVALFALWGALLGFPLLPTFTTLTPTCMNLVVYEGWRGLRNFVLAVAVGIAVAMAVAWPLSIALDTSLLVSLLCMAVFSGYLVAFSRSGHVRAVQLHESRRQAEGQLAEIQALEAQLREAALRDPLTGLYNRRHLSETLPGVLSRCERSKTSFSLVMIDIDHFKAVNDTYGHAAGDEILKALAQLLQKHVRQGDIVCRMGGEEFLLVFESAPLSAAWERAQVLREAFAGLGVPYHGTTLHATISCGLAAFPEHGNDAQSLLQAADHALYKAKEGGRNQLQAADVLPS